MSSVAVVGASERTLWSYWLLANLHSYDKHSPVWVVNPRQDVVHGLKALDSVADLPTTPSLGVVLLRADLCAESVRELAAAGTNEIVVVSTGFKESGTAEGKAREQELQDVVRETGIRLIGPNCVGFADFRRGLCAISEPIPDAAIGPVSIISQSGGLLASCMGAISHQKVGLDRCYSIGNGAGFGVADALTELALTDTTELICCVLEAIVDPEAFERGAREARRRGKHVVVVKIGRSASARDVAVSHTGAAVGDDAVTDAWFARIGVRRANSVTEAGVVVGLLDRFGSADPDRGVFIATGSGGGCGVATDLAELAGVRLATLGQDTVDSLRALLPAGAYVGNPLDVTGAAADSEGLTAYDHVMRDPNVGAVLQPFTIPWPDSSPGRRWHRDSFAAISGAATNAGTPLISASFYPQRRTDWIDERATGRVSVQDDLEATIAALAVLYPRTDPVPHATGAPAPTGRPSRVLSELPGRELLGGLGFTLVPGGWAADEDAVVALADTLGGPWVLKVASETIEHKGRVGGVQIGLVDEQGLRSAARKIRDGLVRHGCEDRANGYLVQQMVFGPEILVGLLRDPDGRRSLNLGVGGWAAEAYPDIKTHLLPLEDDELATTLHSSAFGRLLSEAQRVALADVVSRLTESFTSGDLQSFDTVEINPVILSGEAAYIADALLLVVG